jgi:predicted TPR repeat methyltransferase
MFPTATANQMNQPLALARQYFFAPAPHFEAGRLADAERNFQASLALLPGRVSTLANLAATRIRLGRPMDALPLLDEALASAPEDAEAWSHRGAALVALGRHQEALDCHDRVLALQPGHASSWLRKSRSLGALGRHAEALASLQRLVELQPDNAEAWLRHGQALQRLERHEDALASYDKALALDSTLAAAWSHRGDILKDLGRIVEAVAAFREAIAHGGDAELNGYFLAALTGGAMPPSAPRGYVQSLFDGYADDFEQHLVGVLGYRAHLVLTEPLPALTGGRLRSALDLGCGTGLCGPRVKAMAERLEGVDLSARMVENARALGVYDRVEQAELLEHLQRTEAERHDLVLAADVFIYVGALDAVFPEVRRVLQPGGLFCFSVERAPDSEDVALTRGLRYAHSERYLRALAASNGFSVLEMVDRPIREEQRRPIEGLFAYLRRTT